MEKSLGKNTNAINNYKFLKLATGVFLISPLVFMSYVYYNSGGDIGKVLVANPMLNISFIAAMASAFCAVVCRSILGDLRGNKFVETSRLQLILMLIAQIILFNLLGITLVLVTLINSFRWRDVTIKSILGNCKKEKSYGKFIGVSMIVFLSLICLFVTLRLA